MSSYQVIYGLIKLKMCHFYIIGDVKLRFVISGLNDKKNKKCEEFMDKKSYYLTRTNRLSVK